MRVLPKVIPELSKRYGNYNPDSIKDLLEVWRKKPGESTFETKGGWEKIPSTGTQDKIEKISKLLRSSL